MRKENYLPQDDAAWQVQKRVQVEYQPVSPNTKYTISIYHLSSAIYLRFKVQPARLQMPELDYEGEIKVSEALK